MTRTLSIFTAMNWSLMCQLATWTAACSGFPKMLPLETPSESRSLFVSFLYLSSIGLARTPCTVSSVDPPSTFGSAPLSSSRSTRSAWPLITATSNGVAPSGLFSLTFAPAASNARTAAMSPRRTANTRGVVPAYEQRRRLRIVQVRRPVQRRRAVALGRVDVGARLQQRLHGLLVAVLDRISERRIVARCADAERGDRQAEPQRGSGSHAHR